MATKSYSKHKEYKEYSSSGSTIPPYTGEQFDMMKSDLIPRGSKLDSLGKGSGAGTREYHYEYKEEKHPSGKYDRKDLHTVEEYTIPPRTVPKSSESSSYYYEREEKDLPAVSHSGTKTYNYETSISSTPGYSKVKSAKVTKDLSHNVEELDSLLDDLQKDQERQLYKNGYTSDTAESMSFDFKRGTTAKAPSSGYSTLKHEERVESSSWGSSPPPTVTRAQELRQEMYREEKTESRVVPSQISPSVPQPVPAVVTVCNHCHQPPSTGTLPRGTPMNKVTTTVKTYTYEVPAGQDPSTVPIPDHHHTTVPVPDHHHHTTVPVPDHHHHHTTYVSEEENMSTLSRSRSPLPAAPQPGGCQYCSHCNSSVREYKTITRSDDRSSERMVYPAPANETKVVPAEPHNGHGPYGPSSYKFSETTYSAHNTTQRYPSPLPPHSPHHPHPLPTPSPGPFPRPTTPSPGTQQPPKKLDDLLADFPEARFPTQPEGVIRRRVEVHESQKSSRDARDGRAGPAPPATPTTPPGNSRNVAGPAVYYPPGHTPFAKKDNPPVAAGYQSAAMRQGGGAYASGRGMYEYESGAKMKEKHSETKTAVPICLPLCCAMPCVIM